MHDVVYTDTGRSADAEDVGKLGRAIEDFRARYADLVSPAYEHWILASGDAELIDDYRRVRRKAALVVKAIDTVGGAWQRAKEWVGLGVLPLIPVAIAVAVTATVLAGVSLLDDFFLRADARAIRRDRPGLSYDAALALARDAREGAYEKTLDTVQIALVLGGALGLFWLLRR